MTAFAFVLVLASALAHATWNRLATILGIALLSPLSYILVLTALAGSPVSYVAPAREIGILFGATAMLVGVVALAVG